MDPEPEPPAEPTPAAKGKPWALIAGVAVVAACCIGMAVKDDTKSTPEPAVDSTPWTCARWASEGARSRAVWAESALTALRGKDGMPPPGDAQVAVFASQITTACEPVPEWKVAEIAATLYLMGR
jgi:hypothetical protein